MALQLKLVQRSDFTADIDELDLLSFNDGFSTNEDGILPNVGSGDAPIDEVITAVVQGSSHDDLADILNSLEEKEQQIIQYAESPVQKYGVWLRTQLRTETYARQSLITELRHNPITSIYEICTDKEYVARQYQIGMKRMPWWEADNYRIYHSKADIDCLGGTDDYSTYAGGPGAVLGTLPARLAYVQFYGGTTGPVTTGTGLYKFWCGFRTDRYGDRANFVPNWGLHESANRDADTPLITDVSSVTAKAGYYTVTSFAADETLLRRVTIRVTDVTTDYSDQRGRFLVLLRAKNSAAGTTRVRLADGIYNVTNPKLSQYRVQSRVPITSTDWQLYEMGTVQFPSTGRLISGTSYLQNVAMGIDAERIDGSCDLHMDSLFLIPIDEGFVYADGGDVLYAASLAKPFLTVQNLPGGGVDCNMFTWSGGSNYPTNTGSASISSGLPVGDGMAVLCAQRISSSVYGDQARLLMRIYQRWKTLRGDDT